MLWPTTVPFTSNRFSVALAGPGSKYRLSSNTSYVGSSVLKCRPATAPSRSTATALCSGRPAGSALRSA